MKTKHKIVLIIALLLSQSLFAAYDLVILKTDGNVVRKAVTDIQEITFTGSPKNMVVTAKDESSTTTAITDIREIIFQDPTREGTVTDADGNVYKTVKIDDLWWMTENLKVTKYRDETAIPNVTDNDQWLGLSYGAYCAYNNDTSNESDTYGYIYNWHAVNDSRNIAPEGWRVPTVADWTTLTTYLGGESVAGKKLKSATSWNGTDEVGFGALPGGSRNQTNGTFGNMITHAFFWSSTVSSSTSAHYRYLWNGSDNIYQDSTDKKRGCSVRCVKDAD